MSNMDRLMQRLIEKCKRVTTKEWTPVQVSTHDPRTYEEIIASLPGVVGYMQFNKPATPEEIKALKDAEI